ncbi:hypothetical protein EAF04_009353 [Stromatinia cepivora]|nr:hypothetical protein EAF04_009353 [Stromatinia cepivora]
MVTIQVEIPGEPLINYRTEEIPEPGTAPNDRLSSRATSSGDTTSASTNQLELDTTRKRLRDMRLYQSTFNTRSPSVSSTVIYTPESSVEPTIKQENLYSTSIGILQSIPPNPQEYQNNVAAWASTEHRINTGERCKSQLYNGDQMTQIEPMVFKNEHPNNALQDYQEQIHHLEGQNKKRKHNHACLKFAITNPGEYLQSIPSFEEHTVNAGNNVAAEPDEDAEAIGGLSTSLPKKRAKEEEEAHFIKSRGARCPHGLKSIAHKETTKSASCAVKSYQEQLRKHQEEAKSKVEDIAHRYLIGVPDVSSPKLGDRDRNLDRKREVSRV